MVRGVTVFSLIFLNIITVTSMCDNVYSKRFSREFIIIKNETLMRMTDLRNDCRSGVVLQSKFDGSFYCISQNVNTSKAEKMTCLQNTEEECECGVENPPPSSTNRIINPTGDVRVEIFT